MIRVMDHLKSNYDINSLQVQPPVIPLNLQEAHLYFHQKQYRRVASILSGHHDLTSVFLRLYSLFIAAQLDSQARQSCEPSDFIDYKPAESLENLLEECRTVRDKNLKDVSLALLEAKIKKSLKFKAAQVNEPLIAALKIDPMNWALWANLQPVDGLDALLPTSEPFYYFFKLQSTCFVQQIDSTSVLNQLRKTYPSDRFLRYAEAVNSSNIRDFEASAKLFKSVHADEPWSIDHAHIYSNALFVLGRYVDLSDLANRCIAINRFSPETCCVLGNLWSLNGKHEQAAISFRRAIRMNPDMPSAWVLVGHEFVELRNPSAAIAAYLKATQVSPLDHRAWFGLGQVYDLLGSPAQAADYYRKAAELCPSDGRLWAALGAVFEAEEMHEHALDAYNNALTCPLPDIIIYFRVGRIMISLGIRDDAIEAFYKFIGTRTDLDKVPIDHADTSVALLEIAKTMLDSMDSSGAAAILKSISGLQSNEGKEALRLYTTYFGLS